MGFFDGNGKLTFDTSKSTKKEFGESLSSILDAALSAAKQAEYNATRGAGNDAVAKHRIGAWYIGVECDRELAFRFHKWKKHASEDSVVSPGELSRHAESGHWTEQLVAECFRYAGFDLRTEVPGEVGYDGKPKQYGYLAAIDPTTGQARFAAEVDGLIIAGPSVVPDAYKPDLEAVLKDLTFPAIWESKKATAKKFAKFSNEGVKKADPKYYGQLQINMLYMEPQVTLFSMLNLDNMKFYFEIVKPDPDYQQNLVDRAVKVLESKSPMEFKPIGGNPNYFKCKFCDFKPHCFPK